MSESPATTADDEERPGPRGQETGPSGTGRSRRLARLLPEPGPARLIVLVSLIGSIGLGLYISGSAVYFVRSVGLSPTEVGFGLSAAGLAGLALGVPIGHLADRYGPREVTLSLVALQAVLLVSATQVTSFAGFLVVIVGLGVAESGADVGRQAVLSGLVRPDQRVAVSAYSRAVFNGGFSVGVLAAGVAISVDTQAAYASLMLGNAATALVGCLLYLRMPRVSGSARTKDSASGLTALRDLPYLTMSLVSGIMMLGDVILTIGLPLWLVTHTEAPRAAAAWLIGINTVMVMLLQVRMARGADHLAGAKRLHNWGFLAIMAACLLAAPSGSLSTWPALAMLALTTVSLTLGELWGQSARWNLRYDLALATAQGQYGGVFQLGTALPKVFGPLMVTALTDGLGGTGWLLIGAVLGVATLFSPMTLRWAERTRKEPVEE
ncbi:MFS transporter [Streptomyces chumphonensis]|uniref:MFS transporter n=1 Tax=Streptomyces chumphonensis TaxID=1214925 RepID=UPI003D70EA02